MAAQGSQKRGGNAAHGADGRRPSVAAAMRVIHGASRHKDKLSGKPQQKASARNSLEPPAGSLIVYGRAELEPRTHLVGTSGLAVCKTLA